MNNKTATECWNILRGELDSAIDSHVPMKKQGKRSKKKHLSKEAFRKIRYKQNMWRVYKHTGKDKDYDAYVKDSQRRSAVHVQFIQRETKPCPSQQLYLVITVLPTSTSESRLSS